MDAADLKDEVEPPFRPIVLNFLASSASIGRVGALV
jgi:hypothetical protein